jgi:hypothetical protein
MRQRTSFLVGMDGVAEPTTMGLVISGVAVAAIVLAAFVLGW